MVLARLQVAGVGRLLDLDVDDVADLRLAIEELCLSILPAAHDGDRLAVRIEWDDATISARCELAPVRPGVSVRELELDGSFELADQILDALVEAHGMDADGGVPRAWFRKKRPAP
jgi:hypothetical protein